MDFGEIVTGNDGVSLALGSLARSLSYNADGTLAYIQVIASNGNAYRQSYTYASGKLTGISGWIRQ